MEDAIKLLTDSLTREWRRLILELDGWNQDTADVISRAFGTLFSPFGRERLIKQLSDQMDDLAAILSDFAPLVLIGALADVEDAVLFPDVPRDGVLTRQQACGEAVRLLARAGARLFRSDPVPGQLVTAYTFTKTPPLWKFIKGGFKGLFSGFKSSLIVTIAIKLVTVVWKLGVGVGVVWVALVMIEQIRSTNGGTVKILPQDSRRESGVRWDRWRVK